MIKIMKTLILATLFFVCAMGTGVVVSADIGESKVTDDGFRYAVGYEYNYETWSYEPSGKNEVTILGYEGNATEIAIPSVIDGYKVTSIGCCAFEFCKNLTSVNIPNSVTSIERNAFYGCDNLTNIIIPNSVLNIEQDAFSQTKWIANRQKENPLVIVNKILIDGTTCEGNVIIPNGVISIGKHAFAFSALESVTIPNSVSIIKEYTFYRCTSLKSISIPNSITSIGESAFDTCRNLTNISIPDSVVSIEKYAFYECSELTNISIPSSITSIEDSVFKHCYNLESIVIPNSVTSIGDDAFYGCEKITIYTNMGSFADKYAKENGITVKYELPSVSTNSTATPSNNTSATSYTNISPKVNKLSTQKITFAKIKNYKVKELKKKLISFKLKAKTSGNGKLTYSVKKTPKKLRKYIKVSKKGKVTLKKKAKKGIYKILITAAKTSKYKKATKVVNIKVK